ncbi:MAG: hypothetical protein RSD09_01190 [Bacilli bacterium]
MLSNQKNFKKKNYLKNVLQRDIGDISSNIKEIVCFLRHWIFLSIGNDGVFFCNQILVLEVLYE